MPQERYTSMALLIRQAFPQGAKCKRGLPIGQSFSEDLERSFAIGRSLGVREVPDTSEALSLTYVPHLDHGQYRAVIVHQHAPLPRPWRPREDHEGHGAAVGIVGFHEPLEGDGLDHAVSSHQQNVLVRVKGLEYLRSKAGRVASPQLLGLIGIDDPLVLLGDGDAGCRRNDTRRWLC